jgi:hypothetical protein
MNADYTAYCGLHDDAATRMDADFTDGNVLVVIPRSVATRDLHFLHANEMQIPRCARDDKQMKMTNTNEDDEHK